MFTKKETGVQHQFDLIIGQNSTIEGNIRSEGSVRIDGALTGSIVCAGDVLIGTAATIKGPITADSVEISGAVEGNVTARGAFRIYETGVLFGDIVVASFAIDTGGVFEGMCHINTAGVKSPFSRQDNNQNTYDVPFHVMRDAGSGGSDTGTLMAEIDHALIDDGESDTSDEPSKNAHTHSSHQNKHQGKQDHNNLKSIK